MNTRAGLRGAIAAEWTKLWSVRTTWWCLISGTALMLLYSVASGISQRSGNDRPMGAHDIAIGGTSYLCQFTVVALATLFVTSEYSSGGIRSTLLWTPVRERVALAKAVVLVPVLFVFGLALAGLGMGVAKVLMGGHGLPTSATAAFTAILGMGGYFALLGVLSTGVGWALRSAAGTLVSVLVLLLPLPIIVSTFWPGATDYFPGLAGIDAMVTAGSPNPMTNEVAPYLPWVGMLICLGWTAVALLAGTTLLRRRDA